MAIASARSLKRWGGHLTKPASYCSALGQLFLLLASLASLGTITGCAGLVSGNTTSSPPPPSTLDITNVQAPADTTSTSQIVWTTNVAANSAVDYGTTTSYGSSTPVDSTMVTNHQVTVSGLAAGTTYYYQVSSTDSKGNHGKSGGHSFQTAGFSLSGTISPMTGGNGATLTLGGAASATTTADSLGNYIFSGLPNGTYTVAPSHAGFTFIPTNQSMTVNGASVAGVNFTDNAAAVAPTITTQPGNQAVTAGQTATFTVVATGTAPLSYQWQKSGVNIAGATAASYTTPGTTTADSGATFTVVVSNIAGTATSSAATLTVNLALAPAIQVSPTSINFGNAVVGTNLSQPLIIKNTGTATLTISQVTPSVSVFSVSGFSLPLNIGAGQQTTITVAFLPTAVGPASSNISIVSNAPGSPTSVGLSGTGIAATFTLGINPTSLSFGNVTTGTSSAAQNVTVTNTGNSNVAISQISLTGAVYTMTGGSAPITLAPSQTITLSVQFGPSVAGAVNGNISIVSNASGSPAGVLLTGTGVVPVVHSVVLTLKAGTSTVSGYNVYRSAVSGTGYIKLNSSLVIGLTYTDSSVQNGTTYFYVATAVDSGGTESTYSNEMQAVIP
jgi:hypothetical protein